MRRSKRHGFLNPNYIQSKSDRHDAARFKHADALGLDMADWFRPNAANCFSRIGKPGIVEAMREMKGGAAPAWNGMKKGELAAMAETLATKTLWLPPLLLAGLMALFVVHSAHATELFSFRDSFGHVLTFAVPGTELVPATVDQAAATQAALDWARRFYHLGDLAVVDVEFHASPVLAGHLLGQRANGLTLRGGAPRRPLRRAYGTGRNVKTEARAGFGAGVRASGPLKGRMPSPKSNRAKGRAAGALSKPVQPDEVLAAIVGSGPLPRTEITKKVWEYIRTHHLQNPQNRRNLNADDKLQALFGGKPQATMFELTKYVNQHLL